MRLLVRNRPSARSSADRSAATSTTARPSPRAARIAAARTIPSSTPHDSAGVNRTPSRAQNRLAAAAQATSPRLFRIRASSAPPALASARASTLSR